MKQITILRILRVTGGEYVERLAHSDVKSQLNTDVTYLQLLTCYKHAYPLT